ncbi:NUDIX domain-containing protein [Patescibacteria group bacterium]|nr:NUDIX domain-containing protein [Patescibacteria group bacterium]
MKTRVIVSAVIEDGHKLLFAKKKENVGPYPNTWHLIGGGIEEEESLEESIKREVREEANIEIEIIESVGFDDDFEPDKKGELTHYIFLVYKAKYISGEAKADDDVVELRWFSKKTLPVKMFNRPSLKLFKRMGYIS